MLRIIYILLLLINQVHSAEFSFDEIHLRDGFGANFQLISHKHDYIGELNCQSFIQKLDVFNSNYQLINENYLTIRECELLFDLIGECFHKNESKCIDTNNLFSETCHCN